LSGVSPLRRFLLSCLPSCWHLIQADNLT
jgi:hypothetical protein